MDKTATVTVTVTRLSDGAAGIVAVPYAAVVRDASRVADGVADTDADAWSCCPMASAAFLKFVKEFAEPSAPQLTAKTMHWPQWLAGVLAAWSQKTQIGFVCGEVEA